MMTRVYYSKYTKINNPPRGVSYLFWRARPDIAALFRSLIFLKVNFRKISLRYTEPAITGRCPASPL